MATGSLKRVEQCAVLYSKAATLGVDAIPTSQKLNRDPDSPVTHQKCKIEVFPLFLKAQEFRSRDFQQRGITVPIISLVVRTVFASTNFAEPFRIILVPVDGLP